MQPEYVSDTLISFVLFFIFSFHSINNFAKSLVFFITKIIYFYAKK